MLHEDLEMRRVILARLRNAGIAKIETERSSNAQLTVTIPTAKTTFGAIGVKCWIYKDQISPVQRRLAAIQEETVPIAEQVTPLAEIIEAVAQPQAAQIEVATPDSAAKVAPRRTRTATAKVEEKAAAPARPKAAPKPKAEAKTEVKKAAVRTKSTPAAVKKTGTTRNSKKADS